MSGTTATPTGDSAFPGADPATAPAGRRISPELALITVATAVALGLRVYRVIRPGILSVTQYDDGVYFGSAVRLVHGVLPYRGYSLVQPPGITLLMAPVAALSPLTGTAWAMVVGRFLTAAAGAAAVVLAGLLVRHRGWLAVLLTCGLLAVAPASVAVAHTVMLEPWLVLFSLAGAVAVFDGDRLAASTRRLAWGGVAFGFAGSVKSWAIAPVVVVFLLLLPQARRAAAFAAGVAAGFLLTVLPFALPAPGQFYTDVIAAQLGRNSARVPTMLRIQDVLGIVQRQPASLAVVLLALGVFVAFMAAAYLAPAVIGRRRPPPLEMFAVATTVLVIAMLLWPPYFAAHYAAFVEPFLALAVALPLARLLGGAGTARLSGPARQWAAGLVAAALAVAALVQGLGGAAYAPNGDGSLSWIRQVVPKGACVLSDQVSYLLLSDRFDASAPGCPQMIDSLGTDLALSGGKDPSTGATRVGAVIAAWRTAFSQAHYVVFSGKSDLRVPWTRELRSYFRQRFSRVLTWSTFTVYQRRGTR